MKSFQGFVCEIWNIIRIQKINRTIFQQMDEWQDQRNFEDVRKLSVENLDTLLENEWQRAKELDEKLAKITAILTIAVTTTAVILRLTNDAFPPSSFKFAVESLLLVSIGLFLFGAYIGFGGLKTRIRHGYGAGYLLLIEGGEEKALHARQKAACGFQVMNLIRSNETSAAIDLIRLGICCFLAAILVSFFTPDVVVTCLVR